MQTSTHSERWIIVNMICWVTLDLLKPTGLSSGYSFGEYAGNEMNLLSSQLDHGSNFYTQFSHFITPRV